MKSSFLFFNVLIMLVLGSCKSTKFAASEKFTSIVIDTIYTGKISIRAIDFNRDTLYYAGSDKKLGFVSSNAQYEKQLTSLPYNFEFRSIAMTSQYVYFLSIGNPALLYRYSKDFKQSELVYEEKNERVFYDCMRFWNDAEGIAIGDPTEDCLSVIITRDAGKSWHKLACSQLPKAADGEAAFAASNTNIVIKGHKTWVVSGGKKSRVFYSPDKGKNWQVFDTPIVQGEAMTGIFTADFYDEKIGFVAGGNYEKPTQNYQNKAITYDGGQTWQLIAENIGFGYASCVQFVPNSGGKQLVCVGASGLQYSSDGGKTWVTFATDSALYTIRFLDENTAFAAGKNKIIKIEFKK
ncbi:sialidase family protein [Flavobacterium sedimenticola]|uniref:Oxidoreductase n=1 Tax=Flavobacterium sedimenticola TaxID=3043286 RepID=A0ABT6XSN9_9FLAO|nr:oxidoreductase [Flavobacterium sedimenticola]MDI9258117.1 oxidoreductase [Flavobacterium sedimenticola]